MIDPADLQQGIADGKIVMRNAALLQPVEASSFSLGAFGSGP